MNNELLLKGKVALITGAGSGIGQAIARLFAEEGASVCIADIDKKKADDTTEIIKSSCGSAISLTVDVSRSTDAEGMVNEVVSSLGSLDILVNNAGFWLIGRPDRVAELSEEDWDSVLNVNLKGTFLCSKFALRQMLKQSRGGVIVNISSECGLVGCPGAAAYGAAKAGIILLTKEMALDYARNSIRVNCIAPCNIRTPLAERDYQASGDRDGMIRRVTNVMPLGRLGKPEDVANAALFLAKDESSYITGTVLTVDAGVTAGGTHTYPF